MAYRYGLAGAFDAIDAAIQQTEGWFPGSISYRLNNPGNLLYAGQPGATPHPITTSNGVVHVFAEFPTYEAGYAALDRQVALDASRGETIAQFTKKIAPASDANDPTSYAAILARAAGLSVNDPLSAAAPQAFDPGSVVDASIDTDDASGANPFSWTDLLWPAAAGVILWFIVD
jgi:hypothetical protein